MIKLGETLERMSQLEFWKANSANSSLEEMMLDSNAEELSPLELAEVLAYLPEFEKKRVLELGSGIGRYTEEFAQKAFKVTTVDFVEDFVEANKNRNGHFDNVEFICVDATKIDFASEQYDFVFTNWLFMYMSDEEMEVLVRKMMKWVKPGGHVFIRESCYHSSGDIKLGDTNPTHYRTPIAYEDVFNNATSEKKDVFHLEKKFVIHTYVEKKNNCNQRAWLWRKRNEGQLLETSKHFQSFLDNKQYTAKGIQKYERIFGKDYVSTGGKDTTEHIFTLVTFNPGDYVLDVGCGIGGGDFLLEFQHKCRVRGIDLSENMVHFANQRAKELGSISEFIVEDATYVDYPAATFDVIYSRDSILHISDKMGLFRKFHKWLKPNGQLIITDYCCGKYDKQTEAYQLYVKDRGYHLLTIDEYAQEIDAAGFKTIQTIDKTDLFVSSLEKELALLSSIKEDYIRDFSQQDYDGIKNSWQAKITHCSNKDHAWGLFIARK